MSDNNYPTVMVEITQSNGKIKMLFSSDCGKHGTNEILDEITISPEDLLRILQAKHNELNK